MIVIAAVQIFQLVLKRRQGILCYLQMQSSPLGTLRARTGNKSQSLDDQHGVVVASLVLWKGLLLEHADNVRGVWTVERWSEVLWTLLESAIARARSARGVEEVVVSDERWAIAVVDALGETKDATRHSMWWSSKTVLFRCWCYSPRSAGNCLVSWSLQTSSSLAFVFSQPVSP